MIKNNGCLNLKGADCRPVDMHLTAAGSAPYFFVVKSYILGEIIERRGGGMAELEAFKSYLQGVGEFWVDEYYERYQYIPDEERAVMARKKRLLKDRHAEIEKAIVNAKILNITQDQNDQRIDYRLHYKWLIKQNNDFYVEELVEDRQAAVRDDKVVIDRLQKRELDGEDDSVPGTIEMEPWKNDIRLQYDRLKAVRYADQWWNSKNSAYPLFKDDCTSYVSQCMHQGGVPVRGIPNRGAGWWYQSNNWSYTWSVANSLRWYLSRSNNVMKAAEVERPEILVPGDVICYDFNGDGKWDHNVFVTEKDAANQPLVNAHTYNARHRYWNYVDSPAWTENIRYKFFHIARDK